MAEAHDFVLRRPCCDFEARWQRCAFHDKRMITRRLEWRGKTRKYAVSRIENRRCAPMHESLGTNNPSTKRLSYGLVPEAHAEDGTLALFFLNHIERDSRLIRRARTRGKQDSVGRERVHVARGERIVQHHVAVGTELAQVLNEIVRKRIVIIDDQNS